VSDLLTPTILVTLGAIYVPSLAFGAWLVRESALSRRRPEPAFVNADLTGAPVALPEIRD
jgi:hypothetical protein